MWLFILQVYYLVIKIQLLLLDILLLDIFILMRKLFRLLMLHIRNIVRMGLNWVFIRFMWISCLLFRVGCLSHLLTIMGSCWILLFGGVIRSAIVTARLPKTSFLDLYISIYVDWSSQQPQPADFPSQLPPTLLHTPVQPTGADYGAVGVEMGERSKCATAFGSNRDEGIYGKGICP